MPLLVLCVNHYDYCGGFCEPHERLCPHCKKLADKARREEEANRKAEKLLQKLEQKPRRPSEVQP